MGVRLGGEVCPRQPVLHAEHRLASVDEGVEATTFPVLVALLVQREVEVGQQRADLSQVVLQHGAQPTTVRLVRQEDVEAQLVGTGQREPGPVAVPIEVVEIRVR